MKKIFKICSLLLMIPVLGIGSLLTGCGNDEATLDQIEKTYNSIVKSTQNSTNYTSQSGNSIFSYEGIANNLGKGAYDYLQSSNETNGFVNFRVTLGEYLDVARLQSQFETEMKSKYNKDSEESVTEYNARIQDYLDNYDLYDLYKQLDVVYGNVLIASNDYFYTYQKDLFNTTVKIDGKDLKNLLTKTEKLSGAVNSFYSNLKDRQELAEFLGSTTQVMTSKLKTFNSVYVNLINANFEFNLAFCDVHNKYVLKDNEFYHETAERLAREAALKYAYGFFLDNIKSYQHNNLCDTIGLLRVNSEETFNLYDEFSKLFNKDVEPSETYNEEGYLKVINATTTGGAAWKFKGVTNSSDDNYDLLQKRIKTLLQLVARFDVFLDLYKENAADFDMYTYNELRTGDADSTLYSNLEEFEKTLSAEQTARYEVIKNFTGYDLPVLLDALNDILVGTGV